MHSAYWRPPKLDAGSLFISSKNMAMVEKIDKKPTVIEPIGLVERNFEKPLYGEIVKKSLWTNKITPVTVIGEWGMLYSYSDGVDRFSEPGLHYSVLYPGCNIPRKVPATEVNLCDH